MMKIGVRTMLSITTALVLFSAPAVQAETISLSAQLAGSDSDGTGSVNATYDTDSMVLAWTVEYENLSGPPGAIHFHGPTEPGGNAGVALPLSGDLSRVC